MISNLEPDMLSAIGSISAVLIAMLALFLSHRGESAQQLRQKREEMRGALERLVTLREEQNVLNKEQDEGVRSTASAYQNTKRAIYLEAAESLARQISSRNVSASEYYVLGLENFWDSDFVEAEKYYQMAEKRSHQSSVAKQAEILRSLAGIYFIPDTTVSDIEKGRMYFNKGVEVLGKRSDGYSCYTRLLVYRYWAASELSAKNLSQADRLLDLAYQEWLKIPTATAVGWSADLRNMVYQWGYLGSAYFRAHNGDEKHLEKGRSAFQRAQHVIETLRNEYGINNEYIIDAKGFIFQLWGSEEQAAGFHQQGDLLLTQAEQEFMRLPNSFAWKNFRIAELQKTRSAFQQEKAKNATLTILDNSPE